LVSEPKNQSKFKNICENLCIAIEIQEEKGIAIEIQEEKGF